jgi:hypothetical protein
VTIEKGTWFAGGNISFVIRNSDFESTGLKNEDTTLGFNFLPNIPFAPKDNLMIGLGLIYGYNKSKGTSENNEPNPIFEARNQSFGLRPFVRAYKGLNEHLSLFLQGEARYTRNKTDRF